MRVPWLAHNLLWMLLKEFWKWFLQSSRTSKDFPNPWPGAVSTAKTRATRAHLGGNCGLLLCRCHLHDRKLVPEATITNNPVTDLGFATMTICPLPKESQTQQLTICYRRVCKKSKEILWTMNVKCGKFEYLFINLKFAFLCPEFFERLNAAHFRGSIMYFVCRGNWIIIVLRGFCAWQCSKAWW